MGQEQKKEMDQKIVNEIKSKNGFVQMALQLMAKRQGVLAGFMQYRNAVFAEGPLSEKEKYLIALAATVAYKAESCIPVQAANAMKAGASEDEIIQTILTVALVSGNNPLNVAFDANYMNK